MNHQLDNESAEVLRQWKNAKNEWHGWKCVLTTIAVQIDSKWTAEECKDHLLYLADQLSYRKTDD